MRNKKLIAISLTVVLYCSTVKPASSQPQVLALPLVANPAGLVFVGIVTVAGVSWYIYQDLHKHKVRSRVAPITNVHKIEPGKLEDNNGEYKEVYAGLVHSEEDCKRKALVQGEISGGTMDT